MQEDNLSSHYHKAMSIERQGTKQCTCDFCWSASQPQNFVDQDSRLWNTHGKAIGKEWPGLAEDDTKDWKQVHGSVSIHPTIQN